VRVLEGHDEMAAAPVRRRLTLPGFCHDVCSGCHPFGILSPFFRRLDLDTHGLR
jgi:phytoene dehydrogenase-like protein